MSRRRPYADGKEEDAYDNPSSSEEDDHIRKRGRAHRPLPRPIRYDSSDLFWYLSQSFDFYPEFNDDVRSILIVMHDIVVKTIASEIPRQLDAPIPAPPSSNSDEKSTLESGLRLQPLDTTVSACLNSLSTWIGQLHAYSSKRSWRRLALMMPEPLNPPTIYQDAAFLQHIRALTDSMTTLLKTDPYPRWFRSLMYDWRSLVPNKAYIKVFEQMKYKNYTGRYRAEYEDPRYHKLIDLINNEIAQQTLAIETIVGTVSVTIYRFVRDSDGRVIGGRVSKKVDNSVLIHNYPDLWGKELRDKTSFQLLKQTSWFPEYIKKWKQLVFEPNQEVGEQLFQKLYFNQKWKDNEEYAFANIKSVYESGCVSLFREWFGSNPISLPSTTVIKEEEGLQPFVDESKYEFRAPVVQEEEEEGSQMGTEWLTSTPLEFTSDMTLSQLDDTSTYGRVIEKEGTDGEKTDDVQEEDDEEDENEESFLTRFATLLHFHPKGDKKKQQTSKINKKKMKATSTFGPKRSREQGGDDDKEEEKSSSSSTTQPRNPLQAPLADTPQHRVDRLQYFQTYAQGYLREYGHSYNLSQWNFLYSNRMTRGIYTVDYKTKQMRISREYVLASPDNQVFLKIENMIIYAMLPAEDRKDVDKFDIVADMLGLLPYSHRFPNKPHRKHTQKKKHKPTRIHSTTSDVIIPYNDMTPDQQEQLMKEIMTDLLKSEGLIPSSSKQSSFQKQLSNLNQMLPEKRRIFLDNQSVALKRIQGDLSTTVTSGFNKSHISDEDVEDDHYSDPKNGMRLVPKTTSPPAEQTKQDNPPLIIQETDTAAKRKRDEDTKENGEEKEREQKQRVDDVDEKKGGEPRYEIVTMENGDTKEYWRNEQGQLQSYNDKPAYILRDSNGHFKVEVWKDNGKRHSFDGLPARIEYWSNGTRQQEFFYDHGQKTRAVGYFDNGSLQYTEDYINGKRSTRFTYYSNGQPSIVEWYNAKGQLHRDDDQPAHVKYYSNGSICEQIWYRNGKKHRRGDQPAEREYFDNFTREIYYDNGQLHRLRDKPAWQEWYYRKNTAETLILKEERWYRRGNLDRKDDKPARQIYMQYALNPPRADNPDSLLVQEWDVEGEPSRGGDKPALQEWSKEDGALTYQGWFLNGVIYRISDEPSSIHYQNGRIIAEQWSDNQGREHSKDDHPASIVYHENGTPEEKRWFNHGKEDRGDGKPSTITYDENERVLIVQYRQKGKLHRDHKPASIRKDSSGITRQVDYYQHGKVGRLDEGPAVIVYDATGRPIEEDYYDTEGNAHCIHYEANDKPSMTYSTERGRKTKEVWYDAAKKRHNEQGPAQIDYNDDIGNTVRKTWYYIHGKEYNENAWKGLIVFKNKFGAKYRRLNKLLRRFVKGGPRRFNQRGVALLRPEAHQYMYGSIDSIGHRWDRNRLERTFFTERTINWRRFRHILQSIHSSLSGNAILNKMRMYGGGGGEEGEHLFDEIDSDHDGLITHRELRAYFYNDSSEHIDAIMQEWGETHPLVPPLLSIEFKEREEKHHTESKYDRAGFEDNKERESKHDTTGFEDEDPDSMDLTTTSSKHTHVQSDEEEEEEGAQNEKDDEDNYDYSYQEFPSESV